MGALQVWQPMSHVKDVFPLAEIWDPNNILRNMYALEISKGTEIKFVPAYKRETPFM